MKPALGVPSVSGAIQRRSKTPSISLPRSVFDMSHGHKTTCDTGLVIPLMCKEVLPGDTWKVELEAFCRLLTLLNPIMDNMWFESNFFFVPMRLVWDNTEKFFGEQANPADSISFSIPQSTSALFTSTRTVIDYMNVRPQLGAFVINTLPIRAYRKIWNDWYRDENLQNSVSLPTGDGPDTLGGGFCDVLPRGKRGDYFTCSLPWPQKGAIAMTFPTGFAAVTGDGTAPVFNQINGASPVTARTLQTTAAARGVQISGANAVSQGDLAFGAPTGLRVDFTTVAGATINEFRRAYAIQAYLEMNARGGTRYPEYLHAHWGVVSSDARLQRSEYLGGGRSPVNVSAVAQTSVTAATPQGNLAGVGTMSAGHHGCVKSFEEHGFIFCMGSFRSDMTYQYGMEKMWKRRTLYDFADPAFAELGEQAVMKYEIWWDGSDVTTVWGYQERFAEYKQMYSFATADMRSESVDTFDMWHLAQEYAVAPVLNSTFIVEPADNVDRAIAVPDVDQWLVDAVFHCSVARCLPTYGIPGLATRF